MSEENPTAGGSYVKQPDGSLVPNLDDEAMAAREKAEREGAGESNQGGGE